MKSVLAIGLIFFIAGVLTLPHYGINWDSINHLPRGQAYLHFFLTGKEDYSDLDNFRKYYQKTNTLLIDTDIPKKEVPKRSLFQSNATTFKWFMDGHDGNGHPPLSDILASTFNLILFQNLRLINDVDSYRVYGILLAASLVSLVFYWTQKVYGKFAGLIAALSLSIYPLFWSEAHFNIEKDIPETVFWSFLLFSVWMGVVKISWKWFLVSGLFFGLGLGTKLNILFSALVILPWLFAYLLKNRMNFKLIVAMLFTPLSGIAIFIATWPYLWADPIGRIQKVLGYYKSIGLTLNRDPNFLGPFGINTYPIQWIVYTTPLIILILAILGVILAVLRVRRESD
ncbi:MAG: Glycosyltransferase, partial [Microgenomates group bacterium Gr01-1014_93]